ncbi:alpha-mannosidase [Paenibacillus segetis]|uniref:Alpha-mannosidase n=1 Tax=Paenibacillus segetis TaxID=1325360 RepID=A0ABQ1YM42_9BACL|nr:alpha-mannosidase [Paenibacillus segetis]GGH31105.1 alpha-mannosidase [Paenibacillus segetis]
MFWTLDKLGQRIQELETYRYRGMMELEEWSHTVDAEHEIGAYPSDVTAEKQVGRGDRWKGRDLYVWLRRKVLVPQEWQGRKICGLFDFGKSGPGNNGGFESLFFLNGKPYQGVDSNHKEVFLPQELVGTEVELCFRLWSGLEGGGKPIEQEHEFKQAALAYLDERVDNLYYTGKAVLDSVKVLAADRPEYHDLLKALDRSFQILDWSRPGSEVFYQSVYEADAELKSQLQRLKHNHPVIVRCIGHTHIDVAWLWRLSHTREKAARSFSTVLRLMELYPEYTFLQTQPQLYAYIKSDYPEIYEQIKKRVAEGRWEAGGAMWLEADCNLTSGESLVRQILYGTRFFRDEFGVECKYLWLPDVFGYSWALPQILRKSGIDTFMTTKISWSQYNRMPHDTFQWRGIDGSEILTHFITTPEESGSKAWYYTYNGTTEPFAVQGIWDTYRDKGLNQELLLSYGYGDGGGGVNRDMLEMRRRLEEMPGIPSAVTGRADDYFERLQATVADTDQYVHTWDGELYLEFHRGTYTSQAYNKRMNRKLELLYREVEWMHVLNAAVTGGWGSYPSDSLTEGWSIILRNQFHDIIPGSSIQEVYADSRIEYAEAHQYGTDALTLAAAGLISGVNDPNVITVYNSASFERSDLVTIATDSLKWINGVWMDEGGKELTSQQMNGEWRVRVEGIPALGSQSIKFHGDAQSQNESSSFQLQDWGLSTPHYEIKWNGAGQLISIYDKAASREVLAEGERGNVLQVFEDKPKMFDAWDIDLYYQEKMTEIIQLQSLEWIANGPLVATARFTWSYMSSVIVQDLTVYADSRRIDFATKVDWQERQQLLKVAFPVAVRSTEATYDIQFGNVKRPTHWNTSWDYARFETVGHQWADLSERGYGVSLMNDCKYGYDIKDNVMRLSLLKSAIYPDPLADQGEHEFTYSIFPHSGDWVEAGTVREAWELNNPLHYVQGASPTAGKSLFRFMNDHDNVMVDAVKKAEDADAIILRIHEFTGKRSEVGLTSDYGVISWQECDLMEREVAEKQCGPELQFLLKPYEIKTFLVKLSC